MVMTKEDRLAMALGVEQLPEGVRRAVDVVVANRGMLGAWSRRLLAEVIAGDLPQKVVVAPACGGEGNTESGGGGAGCANFSATERLAEPGYDRDELARALSESVSRDLATHGIAFTWFDRDGSVSRIDPAVVGEDE